MKLLSDYGESCYNESAGKFKKGSAFQNKYEVGIANWLMTGRERELNVLAPLWRRSGGSYVIDRQFLVVHSLIRGNGNRAALDQAYSALRSGGAMIAAETIDKGATSFLTRAWNTVANTASNTYHAVRDMLPGGCSFSEETLISIDDGFMPISEVRAGEYVLAYDEETGEIGYYPVTAVWVHTDPVIVELTIDGETIETTLEHPFFTAEGTWVVAGELQLGDEIRSADWHVGTVENIHIAYQPQPMYNFTVADAHTYFVGGEQWLVHNSCFELAKAAAKSLLGMNFPTRGRGPTVATANGTGTYTHSGVGGPPPNQGWADGRQAAADLAQKVGYSFPSDARDLNGAGTWHASHAEVQSLALNPTIQAHDRHMPLAEIMCALPVRIYFELPQPTINKHIMLDLQMAKS